MTATLPAQTVTFGIGGMDCANCQRQVEHAVRAVPGVLDVTVLLQAERATVQLDPARADRAAVATAITQAGYQVRADAAANTESDEAAPPAAVAVRTGRLIGAGLLALVAGVVLLVTIGERIGFGEALLARVPWWVPAFAILVGGAPVLLPVLRAARQGQVTSHTLMTVGLIAAAGIGQWTTAAVIVFFMRFADWLESLTARRNREALRTLIAAQPAVAHVLRGGVVVDQPAATLAVGDRVLVRPGERIPADGVVLTGQAPVDQAPITGESVPVTKRAGDTVFAATIAQAGSLTISVSHVGADSTFGRIIRLVEEAESHKAPVQRFADRFAGYYLPVVLGIAALTFAVTGNVLPAVAVLVVSCSCAISLATPVVVLASVGNAARQGLLIKGGNVLESLARVDTVVIDKTGTITTGTPTVTAVVPLAGLATADLLAAVAALEAHSEHPLARAITGAAAARGLTLPAIDAFTVQLGQGIAGTIGASRWAVGNRQVLANDDGTGDQPPAVKSLLESGETVCYVTRDQQLVGLLGIADPLRPEVGPALAALRQFGLRRILLLSGDRTAAVAPVAAALGIEFQAELLPEAKIGAVRRLQAAGARVLMIGDGINDAPALAQADVGMAMGGGTQTALEAADIALLRDDWTLVPQAVRLSRRAAVTIRQNLGFTALYNVAGIALAAVGLLPPIGAAAAQSIPDIAIMLNSARLLNRK